MSERLTILMHSHAEPLLTFSWSVGYADRIGLIMTYKPPAERALRLALLKDVTGLVPRNEQWEALPEAWDAFQEARTLYNDLLGSEAAYLQTWYALRDKLSAYFASFDAEAFHKEHCHPNCPWDGQTIFARGRGLKVLDEQGGSDD